MTFTTRRGKKIGNTDNRGKWYASLREEVIADGDTKEAAESAATQLLLDAREYLGRAGTARLAKDGSIIMFRQLGPDTAMYEYIRDGRSSGICMGRMTSGFQTFRNLGEYADYIVGHYDGA
jgi:hypothetical protein